MSEQFTDDQVRFHFFKDLSAEQRLAVLKVFGVYPESCTERLNHNIERRLLGLILRRATPPAMPSPPSASAEQKLMPIEPSSKMIGRGRAALYDGRTGQEISEMFVKRCWAAMVAAAPVAPPGAQEPTCWIDPIELRELENGTVAMVAPIQGDAQRIPLFRTHTPAAAGPVQVRTYIERMDEDPNFIGVRSNHHMFNYALAEIAEWRALAAKAETPPHHLNEAVEMVAQEGASPAAQEVAERPECPACDGKGGWVTASWTDPVSGPECEGERCGDCDGTGFEPPPTATAAPDQQPSGNSGELAQGAQAEPVMPAWGAWRKSLKRWHVLSDNWEYMRRVYGNDADFNLIELQPIVGRPTNSGGK